MATFRTHAFAVYVSGRRVSGTITASRDQAKRWAARRSASPAVTWSSTTSPWRLVWSGELAWWSTDPHRYETRCTLHRGERSTSRARPCWSLSWTAAAQADESRPLSSRA